MDLSEDTQRVLSAAIATWFRTFAGTSALDVSRDLSLDHAGVMKQFELLVEAGFGTLNRNEEFVQLSIDLENMSKGYERKPVTTHIFFPSKAVLRDGFFTSDLPTKGLPEYTTRLHLGAHQIGLAFFEEEVLSRYLNHPEFYDVNDSLSGGEVSSLPNAAEDRSLYVRYGKSRLTSGQIAVTAIHKDLSDMSPSEQRYWHSHELLSPSVDKSDLHFQRFLRHTYEGDYANFHDPIANLLAAVSHFNEAVGPDPLFTCDKNIHLRLPVEQTYKSFCDSASELYKVVGPDGISKKRLKEILCIDLTTPNEELRHSESQRPLSELQLLKLLEKKVGVLPAYTEALRRLFTLSVRPRTL